MRTLFQKEFQQYGKKLCQLLRYGLHRIYIPVFLHNNYHYLTVSKRFSFRLRSFDGIHSVTIRYNSVQVAFQNNLFDAQNSSRYYLFYGIMSIRTTKGELFMDAKQLLQTSMEIMMHYYDNDIKMALEHFHTDILWVGPMQGQMIHSKEQLVDTFLKDNNTMTFNLFNMHGQIVHSTTEQCDILLSYVVDSFYPDRSVLRVHQFIFFSWVPEKIKLPDETTITEPRIRTCLISNSMPNDERDSIYPNHFADTSLARYYVINEERKHFSAKGRHAEALYFDENEVIYFESKRPGCIVHTTTDSFYCAETLSSLHKRLPDSFIRCHSCYLVNPMYIQSVRRFSATLKNGCVLPIPEKKYTKIKAEITRFLGNAP